MPNDPFARDGLWLRCALHAHSTGSDGALTPEALVAMYAAASYDVVAITDHWARTIPASGSGTVTIPGVELDATFGSGASDAHVLALGIAEAPEPPRPGAGYPLVDDAVAWTRATGGIAFLAHPYWSGLAPATVAALDGIAGVEIYNTGCDIAVGRGLSAVHWDHALEAGRPLHAIAADDTHFPPGDACRAWVWVQAAERSPEAVLAALASGAYYSSTGPRIRSIEVGDDAVEVLCSAAASVTLVQGSRLGSRVNAPAPGFGSRGEITCADDEGRIRGVRLERIDGAPYGRIEVEDAQGRRAWSNALWTAAPAAQEAVARPDVRQPVAA